MSERLRRPDGPPAIPWLGSLPWLMRDPLAFYTRMSRDFGPIAYARIVQSQVYMVGDPPLIEELLGEKQQWLIKDATTRELIPLVGHGLLTSEGELWKRQRKLLSPPLSPKRLVSSEKVMVDCAQRTFSTYRDGETRDFHADSMNVTLEVVGRTLLGISDPAEVSQVGKIVDAVLAYFGERLNSWGAVLPPSFPTPAYRRFKRAKAQLDALVTRVIERVDREDAEADHLLARMLRARGEDGQGMSEQQLLDETVTMLLAGHETTALTLMYAVYLLSSHPAEAAKLQQEIDSVLGGRAISGTDLAQMPVLDSVVREALRLYPPAFAFGREVIQSFELGGYQLPVGAQVVVSPYGMHRNPRFWSQPDEFRPERWLNGETRRLPRYVYLPFGGGHRICIGSHFAMLEAGLLLATLVQHASLEVRPGFQLKLQPVITMRSAHGLPVTVRKRRARTSVRPPETQPPAACPHLRRSGTG